MGRGCRRRNDDVYKIMSVYAVTNNYNETARRLNMSYTKVRSTVLANKDKEEFKKLMGKKKEEFIEKADKIIDKALEKLYNELDKDGIAINHLSTVIGILYDKKALAKGESTSNETVNIKINLTDE